MTCQLQNLTIEIVSLLLDGCQPGKQLLLRTVSRRGYAPRFSMADILRSEPQFEEPQTRNHVLMTEPEHLM